MHNYLHMLQAFSAVYCVCKLENVSFHAVEQPTYAVTSALAALLCDSIVTAVLLQGIVLVGHRCQ